MAWTSLLALTTSSVERMSIPISTLIVVIEAGWKSVGGQLLASGVLLLSGHQDIGLKARMGAFFGFFMALAFSVSALVSAIRVNIPGAIAICIIVLCSEICLVLRLWRRKVSE